jgi:hypothetical protein
VRVSVDGLIKERDHANERLTYCRGLLEKLLMKAFRLERELEKTQKALAEEVAKPKHKLDLAMRVTRTARQRMREAKRERDAALDAAEAFAERMEEFGDDGGEERAYEQALECLHEAVLSKELDPKAQRILYDSLFKLYDGGEG